MKYCAPLYLLLFMLILLQAFIGVVRSCFVEGGGMRYSRGPLAVAEEVEGRENDEKRLLRYLMRGYERDVRPVKNATTPVVIQLSITLTQIFDMDEKNQVLTSIVWLDQEWKDELLTWEPSNFGGIKVMRMPCERIWLPDIVLYNNADDYTRGYMNSKAMVSFDGNVFWPPPTKFRSTCPVDVTYFPFDDQTCIMKLGSWTYDGFQVDVTNRTDTVDLTNYVPNGEWELLEARLIRNVVYYSCCPEPFPDLTVTLKIRRKILFYMVNVVLPCMMMSVLTLLVFCLPPESGEKIALGITVLLAFSVFMLAIAEKMPETSESIPLIGIYLTAVMTITSVSVVMTVVVLNCHYKGPSAKSVPGWMKRYLLKPNTPTNKYRTFEESMAASHGSGSRMPGSCVLGNGCRVLNSSISREELAGGAPAETGNNYDQYRSASAPSSVSTIPLPCLGVHQLPNATAAAAAASYRFRLADYTEDRKRNVLRITKKLRNNHQNAQMENEDECGETMLSINVPQPARSAPASSAPSCPSCIARAAASSSIGRSSAALLTHPANQQPCNMSPDLPDGQLMRYFLERQKQNEGGQNVVIEWRQLAAVVDRILFWIFCIITCVSSALFLLIIPGFNRGWFSPKQT